MAEANGDKVLTVAAELKATPTPSAFGLFCDTGGNADGVLMAMLTGEPAKGRAKADDGLGARLGGSKRTGRERVWVGPSTMSTNSRRRFGSAIFCNNPEAKPVLLTLNVFFIAANKDKDNKLATNCFLQ